MTPLFQYFIAAVFLAFCIALGADGGGVMPAPGKLKLTREDVAAAMELRSQGVSWASVAYMLRKASCSTWRATVMRAELLGFAAWPHA